MLQKLALLLITIPHLALCSADTIDIQKKFLSQFINPGDLVFDVGANIGLKASLYLDLGAKVVCIEPQPQCCQMLREKLKNRAVEIVEQGLSDSSGSLALSICSSSNAISTFSEEWVSNSRFSNSYRWDKKIMVKITTLDNLIKQYGLPHFCKIDVENFEYQVLKGLSKPIPYISFEFAMETIHNTEKCIDYLTSLGYTKFSYTVAEIPALHIQWASSDNLLNIIKIHSKNYNSETKDILWGDIYAAY